MPGGGSRSGIVGLSVPGPVEEALERLREELQRRGVQLFAVIDHSGAARQAGLQMPETKVVVFGSPLAGTPLVLAAPSLALDLPLRLLLAAQDDGTTRVTYTDADELARRHRLAPELVTPLRAAAAIARTLAGS